MCNPSQGFYGSNPPLSPAAQAVLDAFAADNYGVWLEGDPDRIAAALQAVADQLRNPYEVEDCDEFERGFKEAHILYRTQILAIAAELEGAYLNGNDVHARTARLLLEKDEVSADERRLGKMINFVALYGMGAQPEGTDG